MELSLFTRNGVVPLHWVMQQTQKEIKINLIFIPSLFQTSSFVEMNVAVLFPRTMWLDGMGNGIFLVYMEIAKKKMKQNCIFLI